jgi:type VI secretion system protein VasJ
MAENNQSANQLPEAVQELLLPISDASPAGDDATSSESYFKLDMEVAKVTPDYKVCIDLASEILREISKDLRVASWLCLAWYRTDKLPGLANGIILMLELLKAYKEDLFPKKPAHKSKAIQYIDTSRFVKLVERETIDAGVAPTVVELESLLKQLADEGKKQFPENVPDLKELTGIISDFKEEAEKLTKKPGGEPAAGAEPPKKADSPPAQEKAAPAPPPKTPAAPKPPVVSADMAVESEQGAIFSLKKILKFYLQQENEEVQHRPHVFGISRILIWGKLTLPSSEKSVTPISAPDAAIVSTLQQWIGEQNWSKLVPAIEQNFLNEDSPFKYWLTAQRYLCDALEQAGGSGRTAAEEIMFQTARLLQRFPGLSGLKFSDNTPFADSETQSWIEDHVKSKFSGGGGQEMILPPIIGEEYDSIGEEYKAACAELPEKFEEHMERIQRAISADTRRRGRFLRILNLANFCIQAKKHSLAKVHLSQLMQKIEDYQLTEWEPALCAGVWESAYLVNLKLRAVEPDQVRKSEIESQQKALFDKIALFDGVLALKLASRTKNKGE